MPKRSQRIILAATAAVAVAQLRATGVLAAARTSRHLIAALPPAVLVAATRGAAVPAAIAGAIYLLLLFRLGVVTRAELRLLWTESRRPRAPRRRSGGDESV